MAEQDMAQAPQDDIEVIRDPATGAIIGTRDNSIPEGAGGSTEIGDDDDQVMDDDTFDDNLAAAISKQPEGKNYLTTLAQDIVAAVDRDDASRRPWKKRLADGIKIMGVSAERKGGANFKGASKVVHPVMVESMVQFQARAIAELWPATGPVKTKIDGDATPQLEEQSDRIAKYLNWQYTTDMDEAFWELDQLLFRLPLEGSCFKQQYFDAELMRTSTRFVPANDVIISNKATNLRTAPRASIRIHQTPNKFKVYQKLGIYLSDVVIGEARPDVDEADPVEEEIDRAEGIDDDDDGSPENELSPEEYTHYEVRLDLDLKGYEDSFAEMDPITGIRQTKNTGIALPYIVTVNKDTDQILAIYRNWDKEDQHKRKLMDLVHYKYLPGLGFYGYGLLHAIGSLSEAATGALRSLLDSAQFANMQGGFKSKDLKIDGKGEIVIAPGQWVDVGGTIDDMRKGFFQVPYKEPSEAMFKLLGALVDYAQRFASTTEAMVGDANNTGPVGTTVALIEQGSKVFSAIHKRCHKSQGEEFQQIGALNKKHLPEGGVTFNFQGGTRMVTREDFDKRVSIIPASDPNIWSQTQRIAQAQGVKQLSDADKSGKLYDKYEVDKNLLVAMNTPDIDRFLKDPNKPPPSMSPVYENMAMTNGKPVKAYLTQDHKSHMMAHEMYFMALPPELQKELLPAFMAHKAEHVSMLYFVQVQQLGGVQLPPPPDFASPKYQDNLEQIALPQDIENKVAMITVKAAQAANQLKQQAEQQQAAQQGGGAPGQPGAAPGGPPQQPDPRVAEAHANMAAEGDQRRKDMAAQRDEARKDKQKQFDLARQRADHQQAQRLKDATTAADIHRGAARARTKAA